MPVGTVSQDVVRSELKTLPGRNGDEAGFVALRKLPYGQILARRDMSSKMVMEQRARRGRNSGDDDTQRVEMELMQTVTRMYEFAHAVVDHNITDPNNRKLDFSKPNDVKALDPKVGQEIEALIDSMNSDVDEDDLEDFTKLSTPSSESQDE